jgi:hypothetical protein
MDQIIIALYHGTLLRKCNLFLSCPTPHPSPLALLFFLVLLALLLLDFFGVGWGWVLGCGVTRRRAEAIQLSRKCELLASHKKYTVSVNNFHVTFHLFKRLCPVTVAVRFK